MRRVRWEAQARVLAGEGAVTAPTRPLSCHVQRVQAQHCEANATLLAPHRVRALAFRLELRHTRWRCVEIEIG